MARILIVDDAPDIRVLLRLILEEQGHTVVEAPDGEAALSGVVGAKDLVILDVMLPGQSGFDVLTALRARGKDCPRILMLTARTAEHDRRKALLLGASGFVTKPFDVDEIATEVGRVLEANDRDLSAGREHEVYISRLLEQVERNTERNTVRPSQGTSVDTVAAPEEEDVPPAD
jgi:DNA-binding response OmpR family regulator